MEYVEVKLSGNSRLYCYHNEGEPLKVGDKVKVPAPRSSDPDAWLRGTVEIVHHNKPKFPTKGILGKAPPKEN